MKLQNIRIAVLSLAAMAVLSLTASAQETLRWKFKKGQKLNYVMTQNMNMSMMVAGMAIDMKMTNIMDMDWDVKSIEKDGTAEIGQKISRVQASMTGGPFGKVEFDSNKKDGGGGPVGGAIAKAFGGLVNVEMTVVMSPTGEIKELKLSDAAKAALKKAAGQGQPGGGGISEDTFRQMSSQSGAIFPAEAVAKGKTWNKDFKVDNPVGEMKISTLFKYLGTESKGGSRVAKIEMQPKMTMTPKPGSPVRMNIKDKGSIGTSYFDIAAGLLTESNVTQNMDMEMTTNGMQITVVLKSVTDMKLKK